MRNKITMGSLFSGSGGFELAGQMAGIVPVWASEIEPFPLLVTKKRFPDMLHLGDIKKMDGGKMPKVEIITGGSPCQDMSIAGKREGLDGSRSNLFREQIRIVKEMRESDRASGRREIEVRPRYMVWENVPGAFSSSKGEDFRCVLEEICQVADAEVSVPGPPKNKWEKSGTIMADGYSVAWRTLDAQYWGVPQRRKRIYLVADFGGGTAPEILFEQDSLRGDTSESPTEEEDTSKDTRDGIETSKNGSMAFHITQDPTSMSVSPCLTQGNTKSGQATIGVVIPIADKATRCQGGGKSRNNDGSTNGLGVGGSNSPSYTLTVMDKHSVVYSVDRAAFNQGINAQYDIGIQKDIAQTMVSKGPGAVAYSFQQFGGYKESEVSSTINRRDYKSPTDLVVAFESGTVSRVGGHFYDDGKTSTLRVRPGDNQQAIVWETNIDYIIRRLTPKECGRLQGFPDGWADNLAIDGPTEDDIAYWKSVFREQAEALGISRKDKTENQIKKWLSNPESDSAKYKMWGNGIALPCAEFVMQGIAHELQRRSMKEITINVPDGTQLLHVLAVIDKGSEIHYEAKFCDLRDGKSEYTLDSCNEEGE